MKQSVGMPVIIVIVVVLVCVLGYFAFKTFGPPALTGEGGTNPYASKPEMKGGPGSFGGSSGGPRSGGPMSGGSGGPMSGGSGGPMSGGPR